MSLNRTLLIQALDAYAEKHTVPTSATSSELAKLVRGIGASQMNAVGRRDRCVLFSYGQATYCGEGAWLLRKKGRR